MKSLVTQIKTTAQKPLNALAFSFDLICHLRSESHNSFKRSELTMRRLYVRTRGRSQKLLAFLFRRRRPITFSIKPEAIEIAQKVKKDGWALKESFLTEEVASRFLDQITSLPSRERNSLRVDYSQKDLLGLSVVRDLICNEFLVDIAASYLECEPIFTQVSAWWSLPSTDASLDDYSEAAQMFHYDMDEPKFVKFFIYLTNVSEYDGPFSLVSRTHLDKPIWEDRRYSEHELLEIHRLADSEVRFTGKAGSLVVADTAAFHRGTPVAKGPRLVIQPVFAVSRFGGSSSNPLAVSSLRPPCKFSNTFDLFCLAD